MHEKEQCDKIRQCRRGSAAVLLCILFLSLSGALAVTYEASDRKAAVCIAEAAFDNAGRSILSCYDKELFDRYSLFGFESKESDTEERIQKIAETSLEAVRAGSCSVRSVEVEQAAYVLAEPENMMLQIRSVLDLLKEGLGTARDNVKDKKQTKEKVKELEKERDEAKKHAVEDYKNVKERAEAAGDTEAAEVAASSAQVEDIEKVEKIQNDLKDRADSIKGEPDSSGEEGRTLRNGRITENLPSESAGCRKNSAYTGGSVLKDLYSDGLMDMLSDDLSTAIYIENFFRNKWSEDSSEESFFQCEQEYILYGCFSDEENYRKAYHSIFMIRSAVNLAFLYTNSEKKAVLLATAEELTPGPFGVPTQALLALLWSGIEAENDMKNLEHGNGVPMMKTRSTWMTDLGSAVNGTDSLEGYLEIPGNSPMTYSRYLDLLLLTVERDTKIYRIEDLIQINLKGTVREEYTMVDHYTGLALNAEISKKSHAVGIPDSTAGINRMHTYLTGG